MELSSNCFPEPSPCCGQCFPLPPFLMPLSGISHLQFYAAGGSIIIVTFVKNGRVFMSISFDCGNHFQDPIEILQIEGKVENIQILANVEKFVIGVLERDKSNQLCKRAVSGAIEKDKQTYAHKECEKFIPKKGRIVNVSFGFRKFAPDPKLYESVDYDFSIDDDEVCIECQGHGSCAPP